MVGRVQGVAESGNTDRRSPGVGIERGGDRYQTLDVRAPRGDQGGYRAATGITDEID
jgi:hypothetical protein